MSGSITHVASSPRTAQKACFGRKTSLFVVVVTDRKLPGLAQHTQPVNHGTTARRLLSDHIRRCFRSALLCAITGPSFLWLLCRPMQRRTFNRRPYDDVHVPVQLKL